MVVGRKSLRKLIRTDGTETNVTERAGKAVIDGEISSLEDRNHLLHLQLVLAELQQVHKLSLRDLSVILVSRDDNADLVLIQLLPLPRSDHFLHHLSQSLSVTVYIVRDVRSTTGGR